VGKDGDQLYAEVAARIPGRHEQQAVTGGGHRMAGAQRHLGAGDESCAQRIDQCGVGEGRMDFLGGDMADRCGHFDSVGQKGRDAMRLQ